MPTPRYLCTECKKSVTKTKNDRYRTHTGGDGEPCPMSSDKIPDHVLASPVEPGDDPGVPKEGLDYATCPQCGRKVKLTRLGYFEPHDQTLKGGDRCPVSGVRFKHARRTETVPLPGDETPKPGAERPKVSAQQEITSPAPTSEPAPAGSSPTAPPTPSGATEPTPPTTASAPPEPSPASTGTSGKSEPSSEKSEPDATPGSSSESQPGQEPGTRGVYPLAEHLDTVILQPFSPFFQPFPAPVRVNVKEAMTERGREIATRLRETFYAYTNRNASDNRSAQLTLGPSEAGSPCDRQLAMKMSGVPAVNPQEGWAPFVGTAVHEELARMFQWANGGGSGSGRYVTEMPLTFGSEVVPRGTGDLLDRVMCLFLDHKLMGRYSLDKLIQQGPSLTYRVQVQIYGYGAERAGEKVKEVAIIGWPRQESSLDKLYVHVEPYDRDLALAALARVSDLAVKVRFRRGDIASNEFVSDDPMRVAETFTPADDCRWCPFHLKSDKEMKRGCPGR